MKRLIALLALLASWVAAGLLGYTLHYPTRISTRVMSVDSAQAEQCFLDAITADRGGVPLPINADLTTRAREHTAAMVAAGTIFHTGGTPSSTITLPDGSVTSTVTGKQFAQGYGSTAATNFAENVGDGPDCQSIVTALNNSPEHLKNITGPWNAVGVGAELNDTGTTLYVTEEFAYFPPPPAPKPSPKPLPSPTPARKAVPACPA